MQVMRTRDTCNLLAGFLLFGVMAVSDWHGFFVTGGQMTLVLLEPLGAIDS